MKAVWLDKDRSFCCHMLCAESRVTFFSFCRLGETTKEDENKHDPATHLLFSDISIDDATSPRVISLLIKHTKTDQGRVGVRIIFGRTDDGLCPVSALLEYLARRGGQHKALFQWEDTTPLAKLKSIETVQEALTAAEFTGFSLEQKITQDTALG